MPQLLTNHFNRTLQELVESCALKHSVLQECEVDKLMDNLVVLGVVGDNLVLLVTEVVDGLLSILKVVLLFLRDLLSLLLALALMKSCAYFRSL